MAIFPPVTSTSDDMSSAIGVFVIAGDVSLFEYVELISVAFVNVDFASPSLLTVDARVAVVGGETVDVTGRCLEVAGRKIGVVVGRLVSFAGEFSFSCPISQPELL